MTPALMDIVGAIVAGFIVFGCGYYTGSSVLHGKIRTRLSRLNHQFADVARTAARSWRPSYSSETDEKVRHNAQKHTEIDYLQLWDNVMTVITSDPEKLSSYSKPNERDNPHLNH